MNISHQLFALAKPNLSQKYILNYLLFRMGSFTSAPVKASGDTQVQYNLFVSTENTLQVATYNPNENSTKKESG